MTRKHLITAVMSGTLVCTGCATKRSALQHGATAQVTVRFVVPTDDANTTTARSDSAGLRLTSSNPNEEFASTPEPTASSDAHHVVLWGGPFNGEDVTYEPAPLPAGAYMFGMFDPNQGAAYQGWISVNDGGDDLVSVLTAWRNTVHEQKDWLSFANRIDGKFASWDPQDFGRFQNEVQHLDGLENQINVALNAEAREKTRLKKQQAQFLGNAEVLMMPGPTNFLQPFTRSTFSEEELSLVRSGEAVTKVVVSADYGKAVERLQRVNNLRDDIARTRAVLSEQVKRFENRRHYYRLTNHLYNHDKSFVENEKCLQDARGMIAKVDQQTADHRRHCHALMYVAGLFAPSKSFDLFDQEVHALQRERAVYEEQNRQIQQRFAQCGETSHMRIVLEKERQNALASIETIDSQIAQINEARVALAKVRESSGIIHREGTARIMTASIIDGEVPMYLVDAIERESLLTVRLQAADDPDSAPSKTTANLRTAQITTTAARD